MQKTALYLLIILWGRSRLIYGILVIDYFALTPAPITHNYPAGPPQLYNVTLTATTGACSNTSPVQTVNANQGTVITFSKPTVCANSMINIGANIDPNVVNYFFEFGDGNTSSGSNASLNYVYAKPGTYQVKVITTDKTGCVDSSAATPITVDGPTANLLRLRLFHVVR